MSKLKLIGLLSAWMLILSANVQAKEGLSSNLLDNTPTHTLTHTLELKPISYLEKGYQLAGVKFLPEAGESVFSNHSEIDKNYNTGNCTKNTGLFTTSSCSYPKAVLASSHCPFKPGYYSQCICLPKFSISSCPAPKYKSSPQCNDKAERCLCPATVSLNNINDSCTQYCDGNCVQKTCTPLASETACSYGTEKVSDNCGNLRDICKPCNLAACSNLTSKPENSNYTSSSCSDCSGTKTVNSGWECISGYHKSGSICVPNCSLPNCNNAVSSKPANSYYISASCTDCSGTKTIYTGWSCASGYTQNGNSCVNIPKAGDILFSDLTTAPDIVSSKTPIGIVFDPDRRMAVSIGHSGNTRFVEEKDIPAIPGLLSSTISAYKDYTPPYESGKENSAKILSFGRTKNLTFSAAQYCNDYATTGTSGGQWFLPSQYEFMVPLQHPTMHDAILATANKFGVSYRYYWTSSNRVAFASIRMEGNRSFYVEYGDYSDAQAEADPFFRSYAFCGINY